MSYTIAINEEQRALLERSIKILSESGVLGDGPEGGEAALLVSMFKQLPLDEQEMPGVVHGFCA